MGCGPLQPSLLFTVRHQIAKCRKNMQIATPRAVLEWQWEGGGGGLDLDLGADLQAHRMPGVTHSGGAPDDTEY